MQVCGSGSAADAKSCVVAVCLASRLTVRVGTVAIICPGTFPGHSFHPKPFGKAHHPRPAALNWAPGCFGQRILFRGPPISSIIRQTRWSNGKEADNIEHGLTQPPMQRPDQWPNCPLPWGMGSKQIPSTLLHWGRMSIYLGRPRSLTLDSGGQFFPCSSKFSQSFHSQWSLNQRTGKPKKAKSSSP